MSVTAPPLPALEPSVTAPVRPAPPTPAATRTRLLLTSVIRGAGQATVLGVVYVAADLAHVLLVPLLVFGAGPLPALGVRGAGVATVTSLALSTLALAWYLASGRTAITLSLRGVRFERRLFAEILRVGAPMSLQPVLRNLTLVLLTGFAASQGPAALAAFGTAVRLEYVQIPLTFGLSAGVLAMVGTNLGAGRIARATRIAWIAGALSMTVTGAIGLLALTAPELWIVFFSADPAVRADAASYLRIMSLTYPFFGLGMALSYAFQAAGRASWPLLATASHVVFVSLGGWIVTRLTDGGLDGLALVNALGLIVYGTTLAVSFRAGAWRARR